MTYSLGIDLGTTYTAAAIARGGRAELVPHRWRPAGPSQQPDAPERDEGREDDRRTTPQYRRHPRPCYGPSEYDDAPWCSGAAGAPGS
jgi:molecular chaperone DnaK (HSP70)